MRLIDADALKKTIEAARCADCPDKGRCTTCQWDDAISMIDATPTYHRPKVEPLLPCKCGCERREHWFSGNFEMPEMLKCMKCGFAVKGKNKADVRREWNKAVKS